jgi:hypothetical protein
MFKQLQYVFFITLPVSLIALAVACASPAANNSPAAGLSRTVDDVTFNLKLDPNPLQSDKETTVEVTATDNGGSPVSDGRVFVSLNANAMAMSPVVAAAEPKGNGTYVAVLRPTGHGGSHTLKVDLDWKDKAYQAEFKNFEVN